MIIEVEIKNIYGKDLIYPLTFKEELKQLTNKKTLSIQDLKAFEKLGIEFKQVNNNLLNK